MLVLLGFTPPDIITPASDNFATLAHCHQSRCAPFACVTHWFRPKTSGKHHSRKQLENKPLFSVKSSGKHHDSSRLQKPQKNSKIKDSRKKNNLTNVILPEIGLKKVTFSLGCFTSRSFLREPAGAPERPGFNSPPRNTGNENGGNPEEYPFVSY